MTIEHDYYLEAEKLDVCDYIDKVLGIEYEITEADEIGEGTIMIFDMEPNEFKAFMKYLRKSGFIK